MSRCRTSKTDLRRSWSPASQARRRSARRWARSEIHIYLKFQRLLCNIKDASPMPSRKPIGRPFCSKARTSARPTSARPWNYGSPKLAAKSGLKPAPALTRSAVERNPPRLDLDVEHSGLHGGILGPQPSGRLKVGGPEDRHAARGHGAGHTAGGLHEGAAQHDLALVVTRG